MTLVPEDDELLVEAKSSRDIDDLTEVTGVQVRLTSFNQRFTHPIEGELLSVTTRSSKAREAPSTTLVFD